MINLFSQFRSGGFSATMQRIFESAKDSFAHFGVSDAFDILLTAFLIFGLIRFLRSRNAFSLVVGVFAYLAALAVAFFCRMEMLYRLLFTVLPFGWLLLMILFLPELRDALERVGSFFLHGFRFRGKQEAYIQIIDTICDAVAHLSNSKTGALIAIECTTRLDDIMESGQRIDAEVNSSLLRNIFVDKAPLHDGAVIIHDGRIAAAGCFFPLTHSSDIDCDLGTRHRAALGMSESSDAVIIVVSEETGTISIANDASLTRGYTVETLRRFLTKEMVGTIPEDR